MHHTIRNPLLRTPGQWGLLLTIFIDEYPAIAAYYLGATETFLALAREGAKPRMRLVVLTRRWVVERTFA
jgi:amino acid permease